MSQETTDVVDDVSAPAVAAPAPAPTVKTATPTAAPAPAAGKTETKEDAPGYWQPDWRERLAGGDDKTLKQLQRYASPEDVWKKARALEVERDSGKFKPSLSKDATPDDVAQYRKSWGVPETADKYDLAGVKIDDVDRPMLGEVMKEMHKVHATPESVKAVAAGWAAVKQQAIEAQAEFDRTAQTLAEDSLRSEWGTEYRRNMNLVTQLLDTSGDQTIKDQLLNGRLEDGTPIGSSPAALKMLLSVALAQNPAGVVVPAGSGDVAGTIDSKIAELEKLMRTNRPEYNKREVEYRGLIEAREKMKSRR